MRFADLARITQRSAEENGPVKIVRKGFPADKGIGQSLTPILINYIEQTPGASWRSIRRFITSQHPQYKEGTVSSVLSTLSKRGKLVKRKLNGFYCYYPASYRVPGRVEVQSHQTGVVEQVRALIRDYLADGKQASITEIANHIGGKFNRSTVMTTIYRSATGPNPFLDRTDSRFGFKYYLKGTQAKDFTHTFELPTPVADPFATQLEAQLQKFVWEQDQTNTHTLKQFLAWVKEQDEV